MTSQGTPKTAVVTGASSGIGAATARHLAREGYHVFLAARREDRLTAVAEEIRAAGGTAEAVVTDVTDEASVARLASAVGSSLDLLVNNAGGAFGATPVAASDSAQWRQMYEINVIGLMQVTRALLPALVTAGEAGSNAAIVNTGSTAALSAYEGGGGYNAAKFGVRAVTDALRLEIVDQPVRVMEIDPGMVKTEEFSLVRLAGDRSKADAVYAGVAEPLVADDIADAIVWMATRAHHVNIDQLVIRPKAQAANHKVHRVFE